MKTFKQIQELVSLCKYKAGWEILCKLDDTRPYIQLAVDETAEAATCPFTGEVTPWKSAKHYLSFHMCDSEVVGAVFGAIRQAEEHEMREWFSFCGRRIYNPHISVHTLRNVAIVKNMDLRENAMSMEET